jgi:hypothetical protein
MMFYIKTNMQSLHACRYIMICFVSVNRPTTIIDGFACGLNRDVNHVMHLCY